MMFKNVNEMKIRMNGDKMHQTDRNALRTAIANEIAQTLVNLGVDCGFTRDGLALNIAHDELGAVNCVVEIKMKDLTFDFDFEVEDFAQVQAAKEAEAKAKAEAKARKIAEDKAKREARAKAQAHD